jgi:hypothetical protein
MRNDSTGNQFNLFVPVAGKSTLSVPQGPQALAARAGVVTVTDDDTDLRHAG